MLEARSLSFAHPGRAIILDALSLRLGPGECLGLTGPSGCGKSTLGLLLSGYLRPAGGSVALDGSPLPLSGYCPVQYLSQSAVFAVNPRWRIGRIVEEAWTPDAESREAVGISPGLYDRYPHEVSGGELQRVVLLRALSPQTRYLVADEITAMLDPITQAGLWHVLTARRAMGLGILTISHDLALLERIATRCMTLG